MMPELPYLLWLLLPLAVLSGWFAGRRDRSKHAGSANRKYASGYFRGINYVINEQPDKAIEVFTRMLTDNAEVVETHLALGSLFRRRGEVERAIRLHQTLIARPALDPEQRSLALCELAMDYHRAGLLDRAENLFIELSEIPTHSEQALRMLMLIYEQEREWEKAAQCARRVHEQTGNDMGVVQAQYSCERAEQSVQDGDLESARKHLVEALRSDRKCVRASLLLGKIEADCSHWEKAIEAWKQVEGQNPAFLDEVIEPIVQAYRRLDQNQQLYDYLTGVIKRVPSANALKFLMELMREREGGKFTRNYLLEQLREMPSVNSLFLLVEEISKHQTGPDIEEIDLLNRNIERLAGEQSRYQCLQCGFRGSVLHWQCPACHAWVSIKPVTCSDVNIPKKPTTGINSQYQTGT